MRFAIAVLFSTTSLLASLYLLYFWFIKSGQNTGATFPLGIGWIFSVQLQLLSIVFTVLNRHDKLVLTLGAISLMLFILSTAYFIFFI
jgi:hypothetical protein